MDILVSMKKAYAKVSNETQSAWQKTSRWFKNAFAKAGDNAKQAWGKISGWLAHKKSTQPAWTNVQIGGFVVLIVCLGLLASVLKHKYSAIHMHDAQPAPTVAMLKKLEDKVNALEQQTEQHATHVAEIKQEVVRNNEVGMLDGQQTPTVAMFKKLEEKVDALEQQQAAYVEETIKKEVKTQVAERNRDVKNKKLQVLRKLVQEIDGDK